jgi:beta-lactamase regulating signal transducer with metallopeptidase domain
MIKMSLLIVLGLAAAALQGNRSAAIRHWILAAAIACAAATPLLERVVPVWRVPVTASLFEHRLTPLALFIPIHEVEIDRGRESADEARFVPIQPPVAYRWLQPIWLAGTVAGLAVLLIGFVRLGWLASRSTTVVDPQWLRIASDLSHRYGLRRSVQLLQSNHATLLVTYGRLRPRIILPAEARAWSADRIRIVLAHELAHVRRGDWLILIAAEIVRAVYWFNPLIWIACRRLRRESELACDDAVLALGVDGADYASTLLDLARAFKAHHHAFLAAPAMARPSSLERRVTAMLNQRVNRMPLTRAVSIGTVLALLAVALPMAGLVGSAQATASFSGTLVDTVGRVLPDTAMRLTGAGSQPKVARSDQGGRFSFDGLAAGDYVLQVDRLGFAATQGRVTLSAGEHLTQDVALQLGMLTETITVTDGPPAPPRNRSRIAYTPPPSACGQTTIGGCIEQPVKLRDVKPIYPGPFVGTGREVRLDLEARIGVDGFVNDVRAITPADQTFIAAAIAAVQQWEFSQTRLDGVPVEVRMTVHVLFRGEQ